MVVNVNETQRLGIKFGHFEVHLLFGTKSQLYTLPETNSSPLRMDGWNTSFLLGPGLFSGAMLVSGRVLILLCFERCGRWYNDEPLDSSPSYTTTYPTGVICRLYRGFYRIYNKGAPYCIVTYNHWS